MASGPSRSRVAATGSSRLLIGLGGLGQFGLQYLRRMPDLTIAVRELSPEKLAIASELGADLGLLMGDEALVELGLGGPADVVFDFVGTDSSLDYAVRNVAPGGLVSLVGEGGGRYEFSFERMRSRLASPRQRGVHSPTSARWWVSPSAAA